MNRTRLGLWLTGLNGFAESLISSEIFEFQFENFDLSVCQLFREYLRENESFDS